MNFDKLILANLVGEVMEEIVEWINNLWITCGLLAGLVDPQSPVPARSCADNIVAMFV